MTSTDDATVRSDAPLRIALLVASVRAERIGGALRDQIVRGISEREVVIDVIDLAEHEMPDDQHLEPGGAAATVIGERIEVADGYVILTPEYNHSYPASLKRAIDWHYTQWMFAPAAIVSYGAHGGLLATEHLRGVFAELHVVTTRRTLSISAPWRRAGEDGFTLEPGEGQALDGMLDELLWWADVLRDARHERPFL